MCLEMMPQFFVENTMVVANVAASEGGGLWNQLGSFMRVDGGSLIADNIASGADADNGGGGIFNNGGRLSVIEATLQNNSANGASGSGGGIFSTDGNVFVSASNIEGNVAYRAGGGIEIINGRLDLNNTTLGGEAAGQGNIAGQEGLAAPGNGGGLHVTGSDASVFLRSTNVLNNVAASEGGGLWNQAGSLLRVDDSTISTNIGSGNAADNGGGGIFNNGGRLTLVRSDVVNNIADGDAGSGGGILSTDGRVLIFDSMVDGNVAVRAGGGIELIDGTMTMTGSTLSDNDVGVTLTAAPGNGGGLHVTGNDTSVFPSHYNGKWQRGGL